MRQTLPNIVVESRVRSRAPFRSFHATGEVLQFPGELRLFPMEHVVRGTLLLFERTQTLLPGLDTLG